MDWLEYFKLEPLSQNGIFFVVWFVGAVGGYCVGRAHAAWLRLDSLIDSVSASVRKLDKGNSNVK